MNLQAKSTIQQYKKSSLDPFSNRPESVDCHKLTLMIQVLSENADELSLYEQGFVLNEVFACIMEPEES